MNIYIYITFHFPLWLLQKFLYNYLICMANLIYGDYLPNEYCFLLNHKSLNIIQIEQLLLVYCFLITIKTFKSLVHLESNLSKMDLKIIIRIFFLYLYSKLLKITQLYLFQFYQFSIQTSIHIQTISHKFNIP